MASVRFADVQSHPTEFLDFTSLTLDEFQQLVPPFEAAFQAHMAAWRLDGQPRTARQCSVYQHGPLPTPEDRLFFLRTSLQTYSLHVVQGRLFGMGQSESMDPRPFACAAGRAASPRRCPRPLAALAPRLGVMESDAAPMLTPLAEEPAPMAAAPAATPASPLYH